MPGYDPFSHGNGLIQIEKAYDYLVTHSAQNPERDIRFNITCGSLTSSTYGIFLYDYNVVQKPSLQVVNVTPKIFNEKSHGNLIN